MTRRQFLARLAAVPAAPLLAALEDDEIRVSRGTGYHTVLTWRGDRLTEGRGYGSVLTLSGGRFRFEGDRWNVRGSGSRVTLNRGTGTDTVATLRGERVCERTGYSVLWTVREGEDRTRICERTGYSTEWTVRGGTLSGAQVLATLVALEAVGA